jgi:hypothetical protein
MNPMNKFVPLILLTLAMRQSVFASDLPIDPGQIGVYVNPYYNSSGPMIDVGKYSAGLASQDNAVFLATIRKMRGSWDELSFAELYVAAIRLYDLGYRNDAVYWYYSGEYRGRLFSGLVDHGRIGSIGSPGYEILSSQNAFYQLVGPMINGYAFGNLNRFADVLRSVRKREKALPKMGKIYPNVAFIDPSGWDAANMKVNSGMEQLLNIIAVKKDQIAQQRKDSGVAAKFSGLTNRDLPNWDNL